MTLRQLQPEPAFPNALPIEIATANGRQRETIQPKGREIVQHFQVSSEPVSIEVDPNNSVLKEISLKTPQ